MKIFIIAALSADGFIAKDQAHAATWTSKEDKQFFAKKTKEAGVVVMGSNTYKTIGRPLKERLNIVYSRQALIFPDVQVTQEYPEDLVARLEKQGFGEIAIIGGAQIYTLFMEAGLVDTLYLSVEPLIFGQGIPLFTKPLQTNLSLILQQRLGEQSLLLEYSVVH